MTGGSVGQLANPLLVPSWLGGEGAAFNTTAYLESFDLEPGTGRLMFPLVEFEGPDRYVDISHLPKPVALAPETIPGLRTTAEALILNAQRLSDVYGNRGNREPGAPLRSTMDWQVHDLHVMQKSSNPCYSVDIIRDQGGRFVTFKTGRLVHAIINKNNGPSLAEMDYVVNDQAIEKAEFHFECARETLERMRSVVGLSPEASIDELAMAVATQLHRSGLYFTDIERLEAKIATSIFRHEERGAWKVNLTDAGLSIIDNDKTFGRLPPEVRNKITYILYEKPVGKGEDNRSEARVEWGWGDFDEWPTLSVGIKVPGDILHPLRSPIIETLWDTIVSPLADV